MDGSDEQAIREAAYFIWENEGRPDGRDLEHWARAVRQLGADRDEPLAAETEAVLAGSPDADYPAVLTKDVPGG